MHHPFEEQNLYSFAFSSIHSCNKHLLHCYHMSGPVLSAVGSDKTPSLFTGTHNVLRVKEIKEYLCYNVIWPTTEVYTKQVECREKGLNHPWGNQERHQRDYTPFGC